MNSKISFEKKLTAALIASILLTAVLGLLTWKVMLDADNAARWVRHTKSVLNDIAIAREATVQIESITRGYMIYADKTTLAERDTVAKRREQAIADIEKATVDNPAQQARIPALRQTATEGRALSDRIIALREAEGFEAARSFGAGPIVVQTRNAYLELLNAMDAEERLLLKERDAQQLQTRQTAVYIDIFAALMMLGSLISAYMMVNRHSRSIIKARRELEETNHKLKDAKEAAEHANASKDTFLATMSHEIRTPMAGLLGMLELLSFSKLNNEQAETLAVARDSGQALGRIIDDILDHAKIKAGKLSIAPEPVSLAQLMQRSVNTYFAVASRKGLVLRQMVDPRISPALMADPLRLLQVLGNLVSNAIKFTSEGYVEVRAELVSRSDGKETVSFSVKDTGIGMNAEVQKRIFQPFEQAGIDTERLYGGTGLGLAISRRLADMMGGDITIDSAPGAGTTMSVTLVLPVTNAVPVERQASASVLPLWQGASVGYASVASSPTVAAMPPSGPLVLAVDDNPTNRLLIARQLGALGVRVQTASNGQEALRMWRADDFAMVITDCNMPEMDGYALARAIRATEAAQGRLRIPVLGWTANALANALSVCQDAGMDAVLTKPSELGQLRSLLVTLLPGTLAQPTKMGASPDHAMPVIDMKIVQEVCGTNREILSDFSRSVRESLQIQVSELNTALENGHMTMIEQASHKMNGSAGVIGAQALMALCTRIEQVASSGLVAELPVLQTLLSQEAQRVLDALAALDMV